MVLYRICPDETFDLLANPVEVLNEHLFLRHLFLILFHSCASHACARVWEDTRA